MTEAEKEKARQRSSAYYAANREKVLQYQKDYLAKNKDAIDKYQKEYHQKNADKRRTQSREYYRAHRPEAHATHLKRKYGITHAQLQALTEKQNNLCAICGKANGRGRTRRLAVDHCHTTGKIRGLLCGSCNTVLGMAKDNPDVLRSAALYLENGV